MNKRTKYKINESLNKVLEPPNRPYFNHNNALIQSFLSKSFLPMLFRDIPEQTEPQRIERGLPLQKIRFFIARTRKRIENALDQLEKEEAYRILNSDIIG
jgi:hypothetical protein